ncbi:MAG: response regulator [bacterium]|nr:response regulator [bacterium]
MRRVLVVDDTETFRRFLERALEMLGYEVSGVDSRLEVVAAVERFEPDVVVLDWHLDGQSSKDLLEDLQARNTPVVVITGDPDAAQSARVPVLGKPLRIETLRAQLEEACDRL